MFNIDTIQNVTRAHHHILWSRDDRYKEHMLDDLLSHKGKVFEHFTHDASILPVEFYPMWQGQFKKLKVKLDKSKYYKNVLDESTINNVKKKILEEGVVSTKSFDTKIEGTKKMWSMPPHKMILDYLWYIGELSTAYRKNFRKFYDVSENIIPIEIRTKIISHEEQISWLCFEALKRMGVASLKEIKNFWDVANNVEVKHWSITNKTKLQEVQWQDSKGNWIKAYALNDIENKLKNLKISANKIKIINPFDPAIRDRNRLQNIFDFEYKIEIFVPKEKRKWGYYVYPLLEGNSFIGRIELQSNRKLGELTVINFWKEKEIIWDDKRQKKLEIEIKQFAKLVGIDKINY